jgi:hypothetical protein
MTPAQRQLVLPSFARLPPSADAVRKLFALTPALQETRPSCYQVLGGEMTAGASERGGKLLPSEALREPGLY